MATEEQRAAALIRNRVVPLVKARGQARPAGPTSQMMWASGPFRFALRTASSLPAPRANAPAYSAAQATKEASQVLPYELGIWHKSKVLALAWDVDQVAVISFQRGPWEETVLALR